MGSVINGAGFMFGAILVAVAMHYLFGFGIH